MSRSIDEIKADIAKAEKCEQMDRNDALPCVGGECLTCEYCTEHSAGGYLLELYKAIARDIPLDRLEEICNAEREGRLVVLTHAKYKIGDRVQKIKGANWHGVVVGYYSTDITPIGYAIESERESGSVQIYPEAALEKMEESK